MANAGWHPDPIGRHQLRYFDGEQWTPHVRDGSDASLDPLTPAPASQTRASSASDAPAAVQAPAPRTHRPQWLVLAGILLVVAITVGTVAFASSPSSDASRATVHGSFVIRNTRSGPQYVTNAERVCAGGPGLRDLNARTRVVVDGDHGNEVTRTVLGHGHVGGDACVFRFSFTVAKGPRYYVVSVGQHSSAEYTFAQLQQPDAVTLAIGGQ
jgi:hypothetical protein